MLPELVLESSFNRNNKMSFILFFLPHVIKCIRNNLMIKDNSFDYPRLGLRMCFVSEVRRCLPNFIKELNSLSKNIFYSTVRIAQFAEYLDALSK